jgi:tetratricopeptide (TPR) repeat protein
MTTAEAFTLATQHHRAGQLAQAEQLYHAVLAQEPNHAEALHFLGAIALQVGDLDKAIAFFQKAIASNKTHAGYWNNLGVAYITTGKFREAVAAYDEALRLRPDYSEAYNNQGIACQQLGQLERAAGNYQQAILHRPTNVEAYNNLAHALKNLGRHAEAAAACEQALRYRPDNPVAANTLGMILQEQGELERAMGYYRQALHFKPGYADASNNLATALKEQGLLAEAVAQYRATLNFRPDHALAYYNLSQFAAEGWYHFGPEELERIQALTASARVPVVERSVLGFTLAGELDRQGAYDEAFRYYRQANDLRRGALQEANLAFDGQRHQALVEKLMATYDRAHFQRVQHWGTATDVPVFVLGMPRSGTTLVEQILCSHPEVFGAGELGEFARLMIGRAQKAGRPAGEAPLVPLSGEAAARDLAADFLRTLGRLGGGARRVTLKTLENYLYLGVIATVFPKARVIHCRRQPLDVCLSCYFQNFQHMDFAWSLEDIGSYYQQHERLMAHWRQVLPLPILDIDYEDLIAQQETVTRSLLTFCGLDWDARCLAFFNNGRPVQTASTLQVRRPLSAKSIGRWQKYRSHLGPLFRALGYPAETATELQVSRFAAQSPS